MGWRLWLGLEQLRNHVGGLALLSKKARHRSSNVLGNRSSSILATNRTA